MIETKSKTDLIVNLKNERPGAKLGQQLYAIPQKLTDIIDKQVFYYYVGDRRRTAVNFQKEICIHLNYVKFKDMPPAKYAQLQESMTPMEDLITRDLIYPFLLFINGRMIRWEYITIICTQERYDLLIRGIPQATFDQYFKGTVESYIVMLPDSITYKDGGFAITNKTMFAFDDDGALVTTGEARTIIENFDTSVDLINIHPDLPTFVFSEENQYSYFPENVLVFNNNLYFGNCAIDMIATVVKINDNFLGASDSFDVKVFFNKKMGTPSYNNISHVDLAAIKDDAISTLTKGSSFAYLDLLKQPFDISMNRDWDYEHNRSTALDKIALYNHLFTNEYYYEQRDFATAEVDYAWLMAHRDVDGFLNIPRRFDDGIDYYVIMLVNGELYEYYRNHKYVGGDFICPVTGIVDGDIIELWFFKNARNFELHANITEDEPYLSLHDYVYNENMMIFSPEYPDAPFEFKVDGLQRFPVEYTIEKDVNDPDKFRIRYTNPFYYGKDVTICSSNRFKYASHLVTTEGEAAYANYFKIDFDEPFMYCSEYDRFLVFYNGRRLMNDHYRLIIPARPSTPFTKFEIYFTVPLEKDARIDVFYLPHHFNDIYEATEDLNPFGQITIEKNKLICALDKKLFSIWLNGKKIPDSQIKNITSTQLQILQDQATLKTLRVTTMLTDKEEYNELKDRFQNFNSVWDEAVELYGDYFKLLGITPPVMTNTEPDFFAGTIPTNSIMWEILRDWYVGNAIIDTTAPFVYDYADIDQTAIIGQDSGGNILLGVCDSNRTDNLDVERPSP